MSREPKRTPTIWFETGDLFVHFNWNLHPTGIQRVGLEILRAARAAYGDRVAFCRLSRYTARFEPIDYDRILAASAGPEFGEAASRRLMERPRAVSRQIIRFLGRYPATLYHDYLQGRRAERRFAARVAPGDVVICLGLPWGTPDYGLRIAAAKRRYGVRFALLIHDVIPFTDLDLCQHKFAMGFRRWFQNVIGACDLVFVSSEFCRAAIDALCRERGWPLARIERIPFGAGFTVDAASDGATMEWPARFVLFVSSIDRRKNHALMLRVWRRLLERHGAAAVPSLIFLGVGGNVGTILAEASADDALRAKVTMIRGASDNLVREAYRRCLFTVYPSFTEGWGLPVAESLAFGKFCIVSNRASLPEVGGDLVDYLDPADDDAALAIVERALYEPGYLAARTARIATQYRAPTWDECARALMVAAASLD